MSEGATGSTVRAQAAAAILACAQEARAAWADPTWRRRERLGDPTARPDLLAQACVRLGLPAPPVLAQVQTDVALAQLFAQTVDAAAAEQDDVRRRRRRTVLILSWIIGGVVLCVGSWFLYTGYQHQAAAHRAAHPTP